MGRLKTIYFGPFIGYGLGKEFIVFLRRSKGGIEPNQEVAGPGLTYGSVPSFYLIMYEGYSALNVEYECVFDGEDIESRCDYGVRVNVHQVILPRNIRTSFRNQWCVCRRHALGPKSRANHSPANLV
jgi:hypothetical protein